MLHNIPREKVLEQLKEGPNVPARIAKIVGGDSMIVGAILSTCVEAGLVKFSKLKVGGSPLYYLPEDESKLENFIDKLNEKDRKTLNMLKEKKILKDSEQDALTRVSLRQIPDFAKPFHLGSEENGLFWRYFLVSEDEASVLAEPLITKPEPLKPEPVKPASMPVIEKIAEKVESKIQEIEKIDEKIHEELEEDNKEKPKKQKSVKISKTAKIDEIFEKLKEYFKNKNLEIINKEKIKKTEYDIILKNHNTNEYVYCKYKEKKTINEGDLAAALLSSQSKKMQCIFLTTGNLTKKAELMKNKEFKDILLEKI